MCENDLYLMFFLTEISGGFLQIEYNVNGWLYYGF